MKKPSSEERIRSIEIRKASKRGRYVSTEDSDWNRELHDMFPEWYRSTETMVFNETRPFGSRVIKEKEEL